MTPADKQYFEIMQLKRAGLTDRDALQYVLCKQAIQDAIDRREFSLDASGFDYIWSKEDRKRLQEERDALQDVYNRLPMFFF